MKNNLKKRFVSIVLMAIIINMFSGFSSTVNANETSLDPTEVVETNVTETEELKVESSETENVEPKVELPETKTAEIQTEVATEEPTTQLDETGEQSSLEPTEPPTEEPKKGTVEVEYYAGHINLGTDIYEGEIGTSYKIEIKDFPGYRFEEGYDLEGEYSEEVKYAYLEYVTEEIEIEFYLNLWDEDNFGILRPENITFELLRNGVKVGEKERSCRL